MAIKVRNSMALPGKFKMKDNSPNIIKAERLAPKVIPPIGLESESYTLTEDGIVLE